MRRPTRGEPATRRVSLRLTPTEYKLLLKAAVANHCTMAALCRDAVNTYVGDYGDPPIFREDSQVWTREDPVPCCPTCLRLGRRCCAN